MVCTYLHKVEPGSGAIGYREEEKSNKELFIVILDITFGSV